MPSKLPLPRPFTLSREVDDITPANRGIILRGLFLAISRDFCDLHARYSVDRFSLKASRGSTTAHLTRCCPPEDDHLRMMIDIGPPMIMQNREEIAKLVKLHRGAAFDLDAESALGFRRRRRGEVLSLEATLVLSGVERLREGQAVRLRELIDATAVAGRLACPVHRKSAIEAVHVVQERDKTVVDLVVCCAKTHAPILVVQMLVNDALLSGPVVAISAGAFAKENKKNKRKR